MKRQIIFLAIAAAVAIAGYHYLSQPKSQTMQHAKNTAYAAVAVAMPELDATAQKGQSAFSEYCMACHGENGAGTENGPPLIHKIYEPNHHGDESFRLAAKLGVRAHHWRFGDMPKVEGVSDGQVEDIIHFIRKVQVHNGIN